MEGLAQWKTGKTKTNLNGWKVWHNGRQARPKQTLTDGSSGTMADRQDQNKPERMGVLAQWKTDKSKPNLNGWECGYNGRQARPNQTQLYWALVMPY